MRLFSSNPSQNSEAHLAPENQGSSVQLLHWRWESAAARGTVLPFGLEPRLNKRDKNILATTLCESVFNDMWTINITAVLSVSGCDMAINSYAGLLLTPTWKVYAAPFRASSVNPIETWCKLRTMLRRNKILHLNGSQKRQQIKGKNRGKKNDKAGLLHVKRTDATAKLDFWGFQVACDTRINRVWMPEVCRKFNQK